MIGTVNIFAYIHPATFSPENMFFFYKIGIMLYVLFCNLLFSLKIYCDHFLMLLNFPLEHDFLRLAQCTITENYTWFNVQYWQIVLYHKAARSIFLCKYLYTSAYFLRIKFLEEQLLSQLNVFLLGLWHLMLNCSPGKN